MSPFRLSAGMGASLLVLGLAACGGSEPPATPAEPAADEVRDALAEIEINGADPEDIAETDMAETEAAEATDEAVSTDATDHDHSDDDHDHDHGDHDHEHEDHDHDHDDHSHDHDHDHDDMAGGAPHVHGKAEGAVVLEGSTLSISLDAALASFGASEAEPETPEQEAERASLRMQLADPLKLVDISDAAGCIFTGSDVGFRYPGGNHGNAMVSYTFECSNAAALDTIQFTAFETFPPLEEVDIALLSGDQQGAATLTPDAPELSWTFD